jgi:mycothiol synthase
MIQAQIGETHDTGAPAWTFRMYREGDLPAIVALYNAADAVDNLGAATTEEELASSFNQPMSDPPRQVVLAEGQAEGVAAGVPLAMGRIVWMDDPGTNQRLYQTNFHVHPAVRGSGIEQRLAGQLLDIARANEADPDTAPRSEVSLLAGTREENTLKREVFEQMGMKPIRYGWTMERPLDEDLPESVQVEGVTIRNYRHPEDNLGTRDAFNRSFIDHFEFHELPQEFWDYRIGQAGVRHDLSWVAEVDGEPGNIAGFCIEEILEQDNARTGKKGGWIALLGTVRGWRGKGLGKSLLLHGMRSLKEAGMDTVLLGVDSESPTGANRLYESVGFTVRYKEIAYKCLLSEAKL